MTYSIQGNRGSITPLHILQYVQGVSTPPICLESFSSFKNTTGDYYG